MPAVSQEMRTTDSGLAHFYGGGTGGGGGCRDEGLFQLICEYGSACACACNGVCVRAPYCVVYLILHGTCLAIMHNLDVTFSSVKMLSNSSRHALPIIPDSIHEQDYNSIRIGDLRRKYGKLIDLSNKTIKTRSRFYESSQAMPTYRSYFD